MISLSNQVADPEPARAVATSARQLDDAHTRTLVFGHDREVEQPDRLVLAQPLQLGRDLARELGVLALAPALARAMRDAEGACEHPRPQQRTSTNQHAAMLATGTLTNAQSAALTTAAELLGIAL